MTEPMPSNIAPRQCGDCGLCCRVLAVEALAKPAHVACDHYADGVGCTIYDQRPAACRSFRCLWLDQPALAENWKPNRSHIVLHLAASDGQLIATVDPDHPEAWQQPERRQALRDWATRGLSEGFQVIVKIGPRMIAIMPDHDIDLGDFNEGERVRFSRVHTAAGVGIVARRVDED